MGQLGQLEPKLAMLTRPQRRPQRPIVVRGASVPAGGKPPAGRTCVVAVVARPDEERSQRPVVHVVVVVAEVNVHLNDQVLPSTTSSLSTQSTQLTSNGRLLVYLDQSSAGMNA